MRHLNVWNIKMQIENKAKIITSIKPYRTLQYIIKEPQLNPQTRIEPKQKASRQNKK